MSLVWHIVCKDFRRLRLPLALWLLLVLGHVSLLFVWEGQTGTNPASFDGKRYFLNTCGVIVQMIGFILAAWLVMEDSLVSSRSFWPTRPISGGRLLAAKVLGSILMISMLPVAVLTPVWIGCGFSLREVAYAATEFGLVQALFSLAAFVLASVTETSGQFLVRLIGGVICLLLFTTYVLGAGASNEAVSNSLAFSRSLLVTGLLGLTPVGLVVHQFLTRRTGRSWLIFCAGIALMVLAGRWWPWDLFSGLPVTAVEAAPAATSPVITADRLTDEPQSSLGNRVPLLLEGRVTGIAPSTHVRVDFVKGAWLDETGFRTGPRFSGLTTNGHPDASVVRHVAGLEAPIADEVRWAAKGGETIQMLQALRAGLRAGLRNEAGMDQVPKPVGGRLRGEVRATVLNGAVLGELPLQAGATLQVGSSLTRIKSLTWDDGKMVILLEERDAWTVTQGVYSGSYSPQDRRVRPMVDGFVVLNRRLGFDQLPAVGEIGTVKVDSIMVGRCHLVITPPARDNDWLEGAVLVKVRFTPGKKFTQPLAGEPRL